VTFTDAAAQSKTFARAWGDLTDGFRKRELWAHLGWQDIKQKYRRSVLGPFWITIATGTTAVAMGGLYSKLFHLELSVHLPYVTLGLIIWNMINASILEGADVFIANEGLIKQLPTPLSVHVYRLVWRQMILFAHNIVIYVVIAIIFPKPWSWADLSVIPALGLIVLKDTRGVQPMYEPTPIVRRDTLARYPAIEAILKPVFLSLDLRTLQSLNARIAVNGENADTVAADYLKSKGFLK